MRAMFYVLSDDHLGSTPKFAPGSQAKPSNVATDADAAHDSDDVVVDMEVTTGTGGASGSKVPGGLSQQLKRKSGDIFSGTSKQRVLSQDSVPQSLH